MPLEQLQNTMALRASAFLNTLSPEQHQHTVFPFSSSERFNWDYRPRQRQGLPFKEMTAEQRAAAEGLLQFSLSEVGYQKAHNIMQLENVLRQIDRFPHLRDPQQYAFTIFGNPNANPWGRALRLTG